MSPLISLRGISKSFDGNAVLKGIDLDIAAGDIIGLVGENGAGKSTCVNIIAGNLRPDHGTLRLEGVDITGASVVEQLGRGIRIIHQELSLAPSLSVAENIFLGSYRAGPGGWVNHRRLVAEASKVLARVRAGHIDPQASVGSLRAGDQQLVEIAKALTIEPRLLIMDEPTSSLTSHETEGLFSLVADLAAAGTAIILITHRLEEVLGNCGRIVVFRDGAKMSDRIAPVTRDSVLQDMVGREVRTAPVERNARIGEIALSVRDLSDGLLESVSFDIHSGEIVGIFGLVGAGRTELLETIFGTRRVRAGEVKLRPGLKLHMMTESRKTSGIFPTHSVEANMTISALAALSERGAVNRSKERAAASRLKQRFHVSAVNLDLPIIALSGGNQQKALFARADLSGAGLLLLDEPTHGVDVGAKEEIYGLMREMAEAGTTILFASSEIPELMSVADRCLVLSQHRLAGALDRREMSEATLVKLAFAAH